ARVRTSAAASNAAYRITWNQRPHAGAAAGAAPATLVEAAEVSLRDLAEAHDAAVYGPLQDELERVSADYFLYALQTLGWRPAAGEAVTVQDVLACCGNVPRYAALVRPMLRVLAGAGIVSAATVGPMPLVIDPPAAHPAPRA